MSTMISEIIRVFSGIPQNDYTFFLEAFMVLIFSYLLLLELIGAWKVFLKLVTKALLKLVTGK